MHIERFVDQFDLAAEAYGIEVDRLRARDALQSWELHRWLALDDHGVAGVVTAWLRPDNRFS
ncbi:MAG: hypothetical protein OEM39_04020 [Acidimicrobiia bacterium]|nr:hypothetical protein [Acidimicrobiia bacterium]MDH3462509.1 hypothetical protein [Acidimicrobiia bacterium]